MANASLPGGSVKDATTGYFVGWRGAYSPLTLPSGSNQDSSGNYPILITRVRAYVNGRSGYPTVTLRLGFGSASNRQLSGTFTRPAATVASVTDYQTVNAFFANGGGASRFYIQNTFVDEFIRVGKGPGGTITGYSINSSGTATDSGSALSGSISGDYDWFSAPPAPSSISVAAGSSAGSISVSWGASSVTGSVAALDGYTVQVSTASNFSGATSSTYNASTTSATITGLTSGAQYYVRVAARNSVTAAAGSTSTWRTLSGTATAGPPPPPTALTVGTRTTNSIALSWTAAAGVAGYDLYRGDTLVTSTTSTSYTFLTLTAGTSYTLGVASYVGTGTSKVSSSKVTVNTSTIGNPEYAADAEYPVAKIGLPYAGSVTATNATSYALSYGNLPPGLTLNTTNGTIGGTPPGGEPERPIQRETFHFNENEKILDSFTFGIRAEGAAGSTPETKQFTIKTVFPGERLSATPTDLIVARRREGSAWVPIQRVRRFNGSTWVDISTT
jgi:hypothetical protein